MLNQGHKHEISKLKFSSSIREEISSSIVVQVNQNKPQFFISKESKKTTTGKTRKL